MRTPNLISFAVVALVGVSAIGASCQNPSAEKVLTDGAGQGCEQVVQYVGHPELAPLCVLTADVADAVEALIAQHAADAGAGLVGAAPYRPTNAEIYAYLSAHGAKRVGQ